MFSNQMILEINDGGALEQIALNYKSLTSFFYYKFIIFFIQYLLPLILLVHMITIDFSIYLMFFYILNAISITMMLILSSSMYFTEDKSNIKISMLSFSLNTPALFFSLKFYGDYLFSINNLYTLYFLFLYVLILFISIPRICNYVIKSYLAE
jgi:hypothetical protein